MKNFTFTVINRDSTQDNLYDIFKQTVIVTPDVQNNRKLNYVSDGEEARIDKICSRLFDSQSYVEEFMALNNIVNPWSLQVGDEIYYLDGNLETMRQTEKDDSQTENATNPKKKKGVRVDPNRQKGVPPTIKPSDFQQILVDKKNQTIKLNTKLS